MYAYSVSVFFSFFSKCDMRIQIFLYALAVSFDGGLCDAIEDLQYQRTYQILVLSQQNAFFAFDAWRHDVDQDIVIVVKFGETTYLFLQRR